MTFNFNVEDCLFPPVDSIDYDQIDFQNPQTLSGEKDLSGKVAHCARNIICLIPASILSLGCAAKTSLSWLAAKVSWTSSSQPRNSEKEIQNAHQEISYLSQICDYLGFSDSFFQSMGFGLGSDVSPAALKGSKCDWDKNLEDRIEGITKREEARIFFADYINHPEDLIQLLQLVNSTAYRFSFERSVLQNPNGTPHEENIEKHRDLINLLKANNIEPFVTLHHFVNTEEFTKNGGFENPEEVEKLIDHALYIIKIFPEITHWITFNEPAIYAFQAYVRGEYPPQKKGDFAAAARVMRNMLIAHCKIYEKAKADTSDLNIGITHQWLNFKPFTWYNPLEQVICYIMSKITHYAVLNFLRTGYFSLQLPVLANYQFHVKDWKYNPRLDFIGVQSYGFPLIKAGFSTEPHPGHETTNYHIGKFGVTFGATCRKGSHVQSFGPPFSPQDLEEVLEEASEIGVPIAITETGSDANIQRWGDKEFHIENKAQADYVQQITPILGKFSDKIFAVFFWTMLRGHLEWGGGGTISLGTISVKKDGNGRIVSSQLLPGAEAIRDVFQKRVLEEAA